MDKSRFKAQISDIIKISVENIYQSEEVISKEIAGNRMLDLLLDTYTKALLPESGKAPTHFDKLVRSTLPKNFNMGGNTYELLIEICSYISSMTDSNIVATFRKFSGSSLNS